MQVQPQTKLLQECKEKFRKMSVGFEKSTIWKAFAHMQDRPERLPRFANLILGGWKTTLIAVSKTALMFCELTVRESAGQRRKITNDMLYLYLSFMLIMFQSLNLTNNYLLFRLPNLLSFGAAFNVGCCTNHFPQFFALKNARQHERISRIWSTEKILPEPL